MTLQVALPRIIEAVYETVHDVAAWNSALEKICLNLGAPSGTLWLGLRPDARSDVLVRHNYTNEFSASFQARYATLSPVFKRSLESLGRPISTEMCVSDDVYRRSPHYDEFFAPAGFSRAMQLTFSRNSRGSGSLAVRRPLRSEVFSSKELEAAVLLAPHLRNASRFSAQVGHLESTIGAITETLDLSSRGVLLLNADGSVLHANREAERIFRADDGLRLSRRGVMCDDSSAEKAISALVRSVADFTSKRAAPAIRVPRPSGRLDYVVWSVPITKGRLPTEMAGVSTIMVIVDPVAQPASRQGLQTLFRLSAAEADIVEALSNGFEAGEIAAKRNVTVNTVRTLRTRAYGKLGIASQLDLYRLVAAIPSDA